ncbi:13023_t:CDS:2, partial [Dentiscutata erythropus]
MTSDFPIADLANNLYHKLDRSKIFPPYHNKPEDFLPVLNSSRTCCPRRSPNSFLLCRKNVHEEAKRNGTFNMRIVSKVTGMLWRGASQREKQFYEDLAKRCNKLYNDRYHSINGLPQPNPQQLSYPSPSPSFTDDNDHYYLSPDDILVSSYVFGEIKNLLDTYYLGVRS